MEGSYLVAYSCLSVIFLCQLVSAETEIKCRQNERYVGGCRSCFEPSCRSLYAGEVRVCPLVCFPCSGLGCCTCINGYIRNDDGECIPTNECPKVCPDGEKYVLCVNRCPKTCETLDSIEGRRICRNECNQCSGSSECCYCAEGYVRNNEGKCIPANQCPKESCGVNKVPSNCTSCDDCEMQGKCSKPIFCSPGCDCIKGYFRDENDNCIPAKSCPPVKCPPNEGITDCVSRCSSCRFAKRSCPPNIGTCLRRGCDCLKGFARNITGHCVRIEDCP